MSENLWSAVRANAEKLVVQSAALMAVVQVESGGRFHATVNGKPEPLIRFEGHYFDRRLTGSSRARARLRGLASPIAGVVKNPASQKDRWTLLDKASFISRPAALESTSWGIGQVMGAHWKWLGYDSIEEFVETARSGIEGQLELMIRYIDKAGLAPALRERNWRAFARGYNGPEFEKQGYHTKLADAYAKFSATGLAKPSEPLVKMNVLRRGVRGERVKELQQQLTALGYVVAADGIFNTATEQAVKQFQRSHSLPADGIAGPQTGEALQRQLPNPNLWAWIKYLLKRFI